MEGEYSFNWLALITGFTIILTTMVIKVFEYEQLKAKVYAQCVIVTQKPLECKVGLHD